MNNQQPWWFRASSIVSLAGLLLTLMAFGGKYHWSLELLSAFRVQFAMTALAVILIDVLCQNKKAFIWAFLALCINLWTVWPYLWPGAAPKALQKGDLNLMQFNLYYMNFNHQGFFDALNTHQPDVVALEEVERHWVGSIQKNAHVKSNYPYQYFAQEAELAVLSRFPLVQPRSPQVIPYFRGDQVLITGIQTPSGTWTLVVVHPNHPTSGVAAWKQEQHINYFINHLKPLTQSRFIMAGDFNAPPWFYQYQHLERHLKLHNTRQGYGIQPTWPSDLPSAMRIPIDHILTSQDVKTVGFAVGPNLGSDHLPVWASLKVQNSKSERSGKPGPTLR